MRRYIILFVWATLFLVQRALVTYSFTAFAFLEDFGKVNKQIYDGTSGPFTYGEIFAQNERRSFAADSGIETLYAYTMR